MDEQSDVEKPFFVIYRSPGKRTRRKKPLLDLMGHGSATVPGKPDYTDFDFSRYLAPGTVLPYAASDGCYWKKCTFCPDHAENISFTQISRQRVHHEISSLVSLHRPTLLHFLDNAMSPALLNSLGEEPPGVPWYGFSRFEKDLEDLTFCQALKKSGCVMLKLGLESGSQDVLDRLNKGYPPRSC